MLWSRKQSYSQMPFDLETDFETAIQDVKAELFGPNRVYLELKRLIGKKGKTRNIPDAYLIDMTSKKEPKLYLVENELAKHEPLKHIAVQILQFSLSYETSPQTVKSIIREGLEADKTAKDSVEKYAIENGYENIDLLLESIIYRDNSFNALVIIDEIPDELENVLISKFRFPVELIALERYLSKNDECLYKFDPFLKDVTGADEGKDVGKQRRPSKFDLSEIDTIVVPAREEGFQEVFIGENCWYQIRIHSSMIPNIKYIAAYQVAPVSAITHIAPVRSIEQYRETNKYIIYFAEPAKKIGPIRLVSKGKVGPLYSLRYAVYDILKKSKTLDDAF